MELIRGRSLASVRRYDAYKLAVAGGLFGALWLTWFDGREPAPPAAITAPLPAEAAVPRLDGATRPLPTELPGLDLSFAAGRIALAGAVPDEDARQRLLHAAIAAFGAEQVDDQLVVDAAYHALPNLEIAALMAAIKPLASGRLMFDGRNGYTLSGYAATLDAREAAGEALAGSLPVGANLDNALVVSQAEPPRFEGGVLRTPIEFALGSAALTPDGQRRLDLLAPSIIAAGGPVEIAGHTDDLGSAVTNQQLSQARADAVRAALILRGVPDDRLQAKGYGATRPMADNTTVQGRQRNRRIEFVLQ